MPSIHLSYFEGIHVVECRLRVFLPNLKYTMRFRFSRFSFPQYTLVNFNLRENFVCPDLWELRIESDTLVHVVYFNGFSRTDKENVLYNYSASPFCPDKSRQKHNITWSFVFSRISSSNQYFNSLLSRDSLNYMFYVSYLHIKFKKFLNF